MLWNAPGSKALYVQPSVHMRIHPFFMKLKRLFEHCIEIGIQHDVRGQSEIKRMLRDEKAKSANYSTRRGCGTHFTIRGS
jgi:hypothetical protein